MQTPSRKPEQLHLIRRWTAAEARVAVEALRTSELSVEEFAARYRLHPVRVSRWMARLAGDRAPVAPVLPVEIAPLTAPALVEVVLGARLLRVPADLDARELARLVRAVEAA